MELDCFKEKLFQMKYYQIREDLFACVHEETSQDKTLKEESQSFVVVILIFFHQI